MNNTTTMLLLLQKSILSDECNIYIQVQYNMSYNDKILHYIIITSDVTESQ